MHRLAAAGLLLALATPTATWSATQRATPLRPARRVQSAVVMQALASSTTAAAAARSATLQRFLQQFQGHYDNHAQVASDLAAGLTPREGGGHEHIHCHLRPVTLPDAVDGQHVIASYYFNGQPSAIFRERLYAIDALDDAQFGPCIRMRIYKLREDTQAQLRASDVEVVWCAASALDDELHVPNADVFWRWCGERFEGRMRADSVEIVSEHSGRRLKVRDDVALWADSLWVNDRGCDAETGAYVYGNIHDIPYKMSRVSERHWTATGQAPPAAS